MTSRQDLFDTLAQVAKALGNGHRLALLERLAQAEASVETLASTADLIPLSIFNICVGRAW